MVTIEWCLAAVAFFFEGIQLVYVGRLLGGWIRNWIFRPGESQISWELCFSLWARQHRINDCFTVLLCITHQRGCSTLGIDLQYFE